MSRSTCRSPKVRNFDKEYNPHYFNVPRKYALKEQQFWDYHLSHCDWLKDLGGIWYGKEKGILV